MRCLQYLVVSGHLEMVHQTELHDYMKISSFASVLVLGVAGGRERLLQVPCSFLCCLMESAPQLVHSRCFCRVAGSTETSPRVDINLCSPHKSTVNSTPQPSLTSAGESPPPSQNRPIHRAWQGSRLLFPAPVVYRLASVRSGPSLPTASRTRSEASILRAILYAS